MRNESLLTTNKNIEQAMKKYCNDVCYRQWFEEYSEEEIPYYMDAETKKHNKGTLRCRKREGWRNDSKEKKLSSGQICKLVSYKMTRLITLVN